MDHYRPDMSAFICRYFPLFPPLHSLLGLVAIHHLAVNWLLCFGASITKSPPLHFSHTVLFYVLCDRGFRPCWFFPLAGLQFHTPEPIVPLATSQITTSPCRRADGFPGRERSLNTSGRIYRLRCEPLSPLTPAGWGRFDSWWFQLTAAQHVSQRLGPSVWIMSNSSRTLLFFCTHALIYTLFNASSRQAARKNEREWISLFSNCISDIITHVTYI